MTLPENKNRYGEQLLAAEVVNADELARGLELHKELGGNLLDVLVENHLVDERKALRFLAETSGARYITSDKLAAANIAPEALDRIPVRHAEKLIVLPLGYSASNNLLTLALAEIDEGLVEQVRLAAGVGQVQPIIATRWAIRAGIKRYYHGDIYAFAQVEDAQVEAVVIDEDVPPEIQAREPSRRMPAPQGHDQNEETLKREAELLRLTSELQRHLAKERDAQAILHRTLAFVFDKLPADEAALLLPERGKFVPRGVRSKSGAKSVSVSETLLKEILECGQGVLTSDAKADERFAQAESVILQGVRSAMGAPVMVGKDVRAVLVLITKERPETFTGGDLKLLTGLAEQAAASLEVADSSRAVAAEVAQRTLLGRYLPPAVIEQVVSGVVPLTSTGEAQEVTILFADICGFTDLAEKLGPREVVSLLNEHFAQMAEVVFFHGGMIDKFVGDAVMAVWGAPQRSPQAPVKALKAALEMQQRVGDMNALRAAGGKPQFEIGIGVHTGWVIFGSMGTPRRQELSIIGDAVATAAKLCAAAHPGQVVASDITVGAAGDAFVAEPLQFASLPGRAASVHPMAVTEEKPKG